MPDHKRTQVLIVEDEKPAQEHLSRMLSVAAPEVEIVAVTDSIVQTVQWLKNHRPDLVFMDIHLTDGISFNVFEQTEVAAPVVFTTAYDEYAIRAFKVNSIDYLLKPIDEDDLRQSLSKYRRLTVPQDKLQIDVLLQALRQPRPAYQERFMVHRGERLMSVVADQIAYFEGEDRYVYLVKKDGTRFIVDYRLSDLEALLDPRLFFRLNRSFIAHFDAIQSIVNVSKSRIKIELQPKAKREIVVSHENSQAFKGWLNR